jgi:hypothetical protein
MPGPNPGGAGRGPLVVSRLRPGAPVTLKGLLVLGDSRSDEYRADDARGGAYAATTLNWLELLVRYRGVNAGPWGTRASPRRTGYEYNWALSASTVADVIADGQHTGGAAQVAAGLISHAILDIGANDFAIWNGTYAAVYDSTLDDAGVAAKVAAIVSGLTTIVDTVLAAGSVKFMLCNLIDRGQGASFVATYPDPVKRARVTNAVIAVNSGITTLASTRPLVTVVDNFNSSSALLANVDGSGFYHIGGQLIDMVNPGDEPHHLLIGDNDHVGTVMSGIGANMYAAVLRSLGVPLASFTDAEIIANAGI